MKKTIEQEVTFCDHCKNQTYVNECLNCGKEFCWECFKTLGIEYGHSIRFSGSGDGYYCHACDLELMHSGVNPLHKAYSTIRRLKDEYRLFREDFDKRSKLAEIELERLINQICKGGQQ